MDPTLCGIGECLAVSQGSQVGDDGDARVLELLKKGTMPRNVLFLFNIKKIYWFLRNRIKPFFEFIKILAKNARQHNLDLWRHSVRVGLDYVRVRVSA